MGEFEPAQVPPGGGAEPSIRRKDPYENSWWIGHRPRRDVAEGRGYLADVDLDSFSDVPNDGASVVPINLARNGYPVLLARFHQLVLSDSGRVLRCLALWDPSRRTHATALAARGIADSTL